MKNINAKWWESTPKDIQSLTRRIESQKSQTELFGKLNRAVNDREYQQQQEQEAKAKADKLIAIDKSLLEQRPDLLPEMDVDMIRTYYKRAQELGVIPLPQSVLIERAPDVTQEEMDKAYLEEWQMSPEEKKLFEANPLPAYNPDTKMRLKPKQKISVSSSRGSYGSYRAPKSYELKLKADSVESLKNVRPFVELPTKEEMERPYRIRNSRILKRATINSLSDQIEDDDPLEQSMTEEELRDMMKWANKEAEYDKSKKASKVSKKLADSFLINDVKLDESANPVDDTPFQPPLEITPMTTPSQEKKEQQDEEEDDAELSDYDDELNRRYQEAIAEAQKGAEIIKKTTKKVKRQEAIDILKKEDPTKYEELEAKLAIKKNKPGYLKSEIVKQLIEASKTKSKTSGKGIKRSREQKKRKRIYKMAKSAGLQASGCRRKR